MRDPESMNDVVVPSIFSAKHTISPNIKKKKKKKVSGEMWLQHLAYGQKRRTKPILYFRGKQYRGLKSRALTGGMSYA